MQQAGQSRETYPDCLITLSFAPHGHVIHDWDSVRPGTIVHQNSSEAGAVSAGVFLGKVGSVLRIGLVSICHDPVAEEFICSAETPPLPFEACKCSTRFQCSCIADATVASDTIAWFRAHRAKQLSGNVLAIDLNSIGNSTTSVYAWWAGVPWSKGVQIFSPKFSRFHALCLHAGQRPEPLPPNQVADVDIEDVE
jgi:hypothetical protein